MRGTLRKTALLGALTVAGTAFGALGTGVPSFGAAGLGASVAQAQLAVRARPAFGRLNLRQGFTPDPQIVAGTSGGPIQANTVDRRCRGYISAAPSHVLRSRTGFSNIRFVVAADRDATLLVMLPNGRILCDDDGGDGNNPLIQTRVGPGEIKIWVGSYSARTRSSYQLGVTELSHISARNLNQPNQPNRPGRPPAPVAGGVVPQMPPSYGSANLRMGFTPDPHIMTGVAGGPVRGSTVNSRCRGFLAPQPSHVIQSGSGFRNLRVVVNSGSLDTTLVVLLPNGQYVCDDDGGQGFNPLVQTQTGPGLIRIWVGSYSQTGTGPYNIGFSELGHVGTNNIPAPGMAAVPNPGIPVRPPVQPVQPLQAAVDLVQMQARIPVTLMGPGMTGNTVAVWNPRGASPVQVNLTGHNLMAGSVVLGNLPATMTDAVVTVTQRPNGSLLVRAEQPPAGPGDRGQQLLMLVRWAGQPTVAQRWSGAFGRRGPRWSR